MEEHKNAILTALQYPSKGGEAWWSWLRDGEYGNPPLDFNSDAAGEAITSLVKEGKVNIRVRKDELMLQLVS